MKQNIVWFDIPSLDIDRALGFYSAVLAKQIQKEVHDGVSMGVLPTSDGGQQGDVVLVKDFKPSADGVMIYFDVNGRLKDAVAAVRWGADGNIYTAGRDRLVIVHSGRDGARVRTLRAQLGLS